MDGVLFFEVFYLEKGNFYFIDEQYFIDFPDPYLEKNREILNGSSHDRPYYYAVKDARNDLYWMIPISSKVKKYRKVYDEKKKNMEIVTLWCLEKYWGLRKCFCFRICALLAKNMQEMCIYSMGFR